MRNNRLRTFLLVVGGFLLFDATVAFHSYYYAGYNTYKERYLYWFGLSETSTVHDFRKASEMFQSHWMKRMCYNGVCLHSQDWECGFSLYRLGEHDYESQNKKIDDCFLSLVDTAPLSDKLGKLRLLCGRRHMVFVGAESSIHNRAGCKVAGGDWGKKAKVFADEDTYFEP
jgi:hypothetical protein